jgi:acetylornithine deacetylase/succinyl-diaminopimelate desuccinylase-like protein
MSDRDGPMWEVFSSVIAHDTAVRPGEHRIEWDDPRVAGFIADVATPLLQRLGAGTRTDGAGNLVATFGPLAGTELLLVTYPATHHGNDMADPLRARRGDDGRTYWLGQGCSEGKAGFVAMVEALRRSIGAGIDLGGRLAVVVSTEGSSSNHSSSILFDELPRSPAAAILLVGTQNRIALGHRGRADIVITSGGPPRHSSVAADHPNPIDDIGAAQQAGARFAAEWRVGGEGDDGDPGRSLTAYRLVCGPVAPHTMPQECELVLDCRFLDGDDIGDVLERLTRAIDSPRVAVRLGPVMLPARIEPDHPLVEHLRASARACGVAADTFFPPWTFDAGVAHSRGIPAVLFGPSTDRLDAITTDDGVAVDMLDRAAAVLTEAIGTWPGS